MSMLVSVQGTVQLMSETNGQINRISELEAVVLPASILLLTEAFGCGRAPLDFIHRVQP